MRTKPLAVVAATLVAGMVLAPLTAHADSASVTDETGDTWLGTWDEQTEETTYQPSDQAQNTDLETTVVKHTRKAVTLKARYADLVADGTHVANYSVALRLSDGRTAYYLIWGEGRRAHTFLTIHDPGKDKWKDVKCGKAGGTWDWDDDQLEFSVPRSCLDDPRWVRFHGGAISFLADPEPDELDTYWSDDLHDAGPDSEPLGAFTTRLHAG